MKQKLTLLVTGFLLALPYPARAQSALENPANGSTQSGISVISGWKCTAGALTARFDGGPSIEVVYGSPRGDTRSTCGDDNNGFVVLWNWNLLRDGTHLVEILDDGVPFVSATVTVVTLGTEFLTGVNGSFILSGFPQPGQNVTVEWQQGVQNFIITERQTGLPTLSDLLGVWNFVNLAEGDPFLGRYLLERVETLSDIGDVIRGADITDGGRVLVAQTPDETAFGLLDIGEATCEYFLVQRAAQHVLAGIHQTVGKDATDLCDLTQVITELEGGGVRIATLTPTPVSSTSSSANTKEKTLSSAIVKTIPSEADPIHVDNNARRLRAFLSSL